MSPLSSSFYLSILGYNAADYCTEVTVRKDEQLKDRRKNDHGRVVQKDERRIGHKDEKTVGQKDERTIEHKDERTVGHKDKGAVGHKDERTFSA